MVFNATAFSVSKHPLLDARCLLRWPEKCGQDRRQGAPNKQRRGCCLQVWRAVGHLYRGQSARLHRQGARSVIDFITPILGIGGKLIDKLFPDPVEKAKAQAELARM